MKFFKKTCISILICTIVVAVYPVLSEKVKSKDKASEKDWLEQLSETARSFMKDPKQLGDGIKDVVGAISETFFQRNSKGSKSKKSKASHDGEHPAEKYARPETDKAPITANNMFDMLQEIQQIYSDFNEGKKLNYKKVTKLVIRFLDFIVDNSDMDTFLIEMLSKFEYGPITKPIIKSTLESVLGGYRSIRKMNGIGEILEAASKYVSLDTLADKNYLRTLVSTYGTLGLGPTIYEQYKALADSIIDLLSVLVGHIREANLGDASKAKSQFLVKAFDEYITLIPARELIAAFDKYNHIFKSLNEMHNDKIGNLLPSFKKAESELRLRGAKFDSKYSQEIESVFTKLKGVASDLKTVSKMIGETKSADNPKLKKDVDEFSQKIQAELKRWALLKEIRQKSADIKNIEEWKMLINEMAKFTNGVTNFEKLTKAVMVVYEELSKVLSDSGFFNLKRKTEL